VCGDAMVCFATHIHVVPASEHTLYAKYKLCIGASTSMAANNACIIFLYSDKSNQAAFSGIYCPWELHKKLQHPTLGACQ
jgi:hypothetical protein